MEAPGNQAADVDASVFAASVRGVVQQLWSTNTRLNLDWKKDPEGNVLIFNEHKCNPHHFHRNVHALCMFTEACSSFVMDRDRGLFTSQSQERLKSISVCSGLVGFGGAQLFFQCSLVQSSTDEPFIWVFLATDSIPTHFLNIEIPTFFNCWIVRTKGLIN